MCSRLFDNYCTCCKACCKHNTQRVVNGVYLMLLNTCEEDSNIHNTSFMMRFKWIDIVIG